MLEHEQELLSPLTGEDNEWMETDEPGVLQNKRCPSVFKEGDRAYYLNGKVFVDPDGSQWFDHRSSVDITFPCIPNTEYIYLKEED